MGVNALSVRAERTGARLTRRSDALVLPQAPSTSRTGSFWTACAASASSRNGILRRCARQGSDVEAFRLTGRADTWRFGCVCVRVSARNERGSGCVRDAA